MTTWHYVIMKKEDEGEAYYGIHEYISDGSWTEDAIAPGGETPEEVIAELERMLRDAKKRKVLDYETGKEID